MKHELYVRNSDFSAFTLNEDGETYSIESSKKAWPTHRHHKYTEEVLVSHGFFPGSLEMIPLLTELNNMYHKNQSMLFKTDHHGDEED